MSCGPCLAPLTVGSLLSRLSDILSQMMSTSLSKVCFTLMLSLALASKNSKPAEREEGKGWGHMSSSGEKLLQVIHLSDRVRDKPAGLKSKLAPEKPTPASVAPRLTQLIRQLPAPLRGHHSFLLHVTLVPHQQDLGVVPRVRLDLSGPVDRRQRTLDKTWEKSRDARAGRPAMGRQRNWQKKRLF